MSIDFIEKLNTMLHYVYCDKTPYISAGKSLDWAVMEKMIQNILWQQEIEKKEQKKLEEILRPEPETEEIITGDITYLFFSMLYFNIIIYTINY